MKGIVSDINFEKYQNEFKNAKPYPHIVIDGFFSSPFLKNVKDL